MKFAIETLIVARKAMIRTLESVPLERWTEIPTGFRNHLFWNAMHSVVVQQRIYYKMNGLQSHISDELVQKYTKDTLGAQDDVLEFQSLILDTAHKTLQDYNLGLFDGIEFVPTTIGPQMPINSIVEAAQFVNFHEGMHVGYMMAQKKALGI